MISLIPKKLFALKEAELALKSAADDNTASISSNKRISISVAQEAELEAELCRSIRNWMVGKKFHESVSRKYRICLHFGLCSRTQIYKRIFPYDSIFNFPLYACFEYYCGRFFITISHTNIHLFFNILLQMYETVDSELIEELVGYVEDGVNEYKCRFKCPACPKKIVVNYKVYVTGARKRKNNQNPIESRRKPVWYFTNLQSHLMKRHHGCQIEEILVDNEASSNTHDGESQNTLTNNNTDKIVTEEDFHLNDNAIFNDDEQGLITYDPFGLHENSNCSTIKAQTPKKRIVTKFWDQLQANNKEREKTVSAKASLF